MWHKKMQTIVSCSSPKAKFLAMATTTCDMKQIWPFLQDMDIIVRSPLHIYSDTQVFIFIANHPCAY